MAIERLATIACLDGRRCSMGEVYRARDERLDRDVAIRFCLSIVRDDLRAVIGLLKKRVPHRSFNHRI